MTPPRRKGGLMAPKKAVEPRRLAPFIRSEDDPNDEAMALGEADMDTLQGDLCLLDDQLAGLELQVRWLFERHESFAKESEKSREVVESCRTFCSSIAFLRKISNRALIATDSTRWAFAPQGAANATP